MDDYVYARLPRRPPLQRQISFHHRHQYLVPRPLLRPRLSLDPRRRRRHPTCHYRRNSQPMVLSPPDSPGADLPPSHTSGLRSRHNHLIRHNLPFYASRPPHPPPVSRPPTPHPRAHYSLHLNAHSVPTRHPHIPPDPYLRRNPLATPCTFFPRSRAPFVPSPQQPSNCPKSPPPYHIPLLILQPPSLQPFSPPPTRNPLHHVSRPRLRRLGQHRPPTDPLDLPRRNLRNKGIPLRLHRWPYRCGNWLGRSGRYGRRPNGRRGCGGSVLGE